MIFNERKRKLTPRQFDAEVERLAEWVKASVSPFIADTPGKKETRVRRAREDQDYFNQTYLPHYFTQPGADFHREMEELIDEGERQQRPVVVAAPRGHAKSTRISLARALKKTLFGEKRFNIKISDTETQAKGNSVSMRIECEHNQRIAHDFGPQRTGQWAAGDFVTRSGTRVLARGDGQGIRGLKNGPYRPDLIDIDDIDNDESVRNPQRVKQTHDWIMEAVYPSLDPVRGALFIVGTLLSKRSVLARLISNPVCISKIYRAIDDNDQPLWPERFTIERLLRIKELIGSVSFNKEYQNDPRDEEGMFREEWIKRYKWDAIPEIALFHYAGRDPSVKSGQSNDYKAHVTAARGGAKLYVRYASIKRISVDQMVKEDFRLVRRFGTLQLGLESEGWQELFRRDYDREAEIQKFYLPIVPIERKGVSKDSEARVGHLSPLVENGVILFAEGPASEVGDMEELIEQLIYFPSTTVHDDGPDALEIAVHLAEKRVMSKPFYQKVAQRAAHFGEGAW